MCDSYPKQVDILLYKVQFTPIKFNYWNTWYKKLARKLLGTKRAYWLFYRNALTLKYAGESYVKRDENVRG